MATLANGSFDVKLAPMPMDDATIGRMSIEKQFHGDLEASSNGQMLSAMAAVKGSGGYVAIEHVSGTLHGKAGSFVLQHSGTMTRGDGRTTVTVIPDSGTDDLIGLAGTMTILIADGEHSYEFDYTIAESR